MIKNYTYYLLDKLLIGSFTVHLPSECLINVSVKVLKETVLITVWIWHYLMFSWLLMKRFCSIFMHI